MTDISDANEELQPEELEEYDPDPPKLLEDTPGEFDRFRSEFQERFEFDKCREEDKLMCFFECLRLSKSKVCSILECAINKQEITDLESAFDLIQTYLEHEWEIKDYLKAKKASLIKKLKLASNGWFEEQGYYLNGIAFPLMLKFDECYLPIFLTCAHCAKRKGASTYKSQIIITPATTPNHDESFIFRLDPTDCQTGVFGCDAQDTENADALDFLVLFLKDKTNESRQQIKNFWRAERNIEEGDAINMASTHAYHSQSAKDIPVIQEGKIAKVPAFIDGELIESVALHDVVGISSISGECLYSVETNVFECRLMFRGELTEPERSLPTYIGVPITSVINELKKSCGEKKLNRFWYESVPKDIKTEGFVESYLVLITDQIPSDQNYDGEETDSSEKENSKNTAIQEADCELDEGDETECENNLSSFLGGNGDETEEGELNISEVNPELIVDADEISTDVIPN